MFVKVCFIFAILAIPIYFLFTNIQDQKPVAILINDWDFETEMSDLEKALIKLGVSDFKIYRTYYNEFPERGTFSALIIGGGTSMNKYFDDYGNMQRGAKLIESLTVPVLGICMGSQIIERIYGGWLEPFEQRGWSEINVVKDDLILKGLHSNFEAWENHGFGLAVLPEEFEILCSGENDSIQMMKHKNLPIYATLFHPEKQDLEKESSGKAILKNFIDLVKK